MYLTQTGNLTLIDDAMALSTAVLDVLSRDGIIAEIFVTGEMKGGTIHITFHDPQDEEISVLHGVMDSMIIWTPSRLAPLIFSTFRPTIG